MGDLGKCQVNNDTNRSPPDDAAVYARGYLNRMKCPAMLKGAADFLYLDAEDQTAVLFRGLTHPAKEIWVAQKPGEGSLQAKVGAVAVCNQHAYLFLDNHFYCIHRARDSLDMSKA